MTHQSNDPKNWWCPECRKAVLPIDVTYFETHDERAGGCGHKVLPNPPAPMSSKTVSDRIIETDSCIDEIEWFATRKIDLAKESERSGRPWADTLMSDICDLRARLKDERALRASTVETSAPQIWCIDKQHEGTFCPFTKRPYFMHIDHDELGRVPTYGGPFDSYTIPSPDDDGHLRCERYDHDAGQWVEGGEPAGLIVVSEDEYNDLYERGKPPIPPETPDNRMQMAERLLRSAHRELSLSPDDKALTARIGEWLDGSHVKTSPGLTAGGPLTGEEIASGIDDPHSDLPVEINP
jgi:hypothetical protein